MRRCPGIGPVVLRLVRDIHRADTVDASPPLRDCDGAHL